MGTFRCVWKMASVDQIVGTFWPPKFLGHFGPPNESNFRFSTTLLKRFLWIHFSLALHAHWRCVQYGPNFWAILNPKVNQNSGLWSLSQKVFIGFTSVLLHMLIASTFKQMGLRGPIVEPFWAPSKSNSGLWSISQNVFTGFTSVLLHMFIASTWCVENMGHRGLVFGPFGPPNKNSGLCSFSQIFSTAFAPVLVYMLIWATFKGVMNIGLICPISGSFWAPN